MTKIIIAIVSPALLAGGFLFQGFFESSEPIQQSSSGTISISGAFALYPLAVKWGEEYQKIHPDVTFDIQGGGAGKGMADVLTETVDIGMVSREINPEELQRGALAIPVAKDAVIPTINEKNPYVAQIYKRGITKEEFRKIWIESSITSWNDLLKNGAKEKIAVYTRSDAAGAPETWAKFLGGKQENLKGIGVFGDPGLTQIVARNIFAVGFNNVNYLYDISTRKPFAGVRPLPIDVNGNGRLDNNENFYRTLDELNAAIAKGKYPSPPARDLYFVTKGKTKNQLVQRFLDWVLTDGQQFVAQAGYVEIKNSLAENKSKKEPK